MKRFVLGLTLALAGVASWAGDQSACEAAGGSYRSGTVVKAPVFSHGQYRKGVELSHTHLKLVADQDGQTYDVAIDNVFANGYQAQQAIVPAPLSAIRVNDRLSMCGQLYDRGVGIHFVHTNCAASPSAQHPDGWLKSLSANGIASANLEANTSYCSLFQRPSRMAHERDARR